MLLLAPILVPLLAALLAALVPSERRRPLLVPAAALIHLAATAALLPRAGSARAGAWLALDPLGAVILGLVSVLFLLCALYAPAYLRLRSDRPNRVLCVCLLVFLSMMSLIALSQHLGLLWVAVEATTLSTAPLVFFNRNARSIEATWKYLMLCSVGIALALLGSLFLSYAAFLGGRGSSLLFADLLSGAGSFSRPWLRTAFVFLLVGYGTKLGLAPLHSWKPDVYGEVPGLVGALLAGGLTSCAFLAILRVYRIVAAAGEGPFARELLLILGIASMAVAAVFLQGQRDIKRMLAYSSVEHMGILALGIALGGIGVFGALLHTINNALTKGVLFLSAGNIHRAYGSKSADAVTGASRRVPISAGLFLAGFFAITGSPPFGPFVSELTILRAAFAGGRAGVAALYLLLLGAVFVGMGSTVLAVVGGRSAREASPVPRRDTAARTLPIILLMALVLLLGLWIPAPLSDLLKAAGAGLGGQP